MSKILAKIQLEMLETLSNVYNENELFEFIELKIDEISVLDENQKTQIETNDKYVSLEKLQAIRDDVETFIDLNEELQCPLDYNYAILLSKDLLKLKNNLTGFAINKRIDKELRELKSKIPKLKRDDEIAQENAINSRIATLHKNSPKCHQGHNMIIRQGGDEYFWGCNRFPECFSKRQLTKNEREFLFFNTPFIVPTDPPNKDLPSMNTSNPPNTEITIQSDQLKDFFYNIYDSNFEFGNDSGDIEVNPNNVVDLQNENYVSTSALGKSHEIQGKFLFAFFSKLGWVKIINNERRLTKIGLQKGARYKTYNYDHFFIVWPKYLFKKIETIISEYDLWKFVPTSVDVDDDTSSKMNAQPKRDKEELKTVIESALSKSEAISKSQSGNSVETVINSAQNKIDSAPLDRDEITDILLALAQGINPINGENIQSDSVLQNIKISRALFLAARELEKKVTFTNKKGEYQEPELDDSGYELFNRLKEWRLEIARDKNVPAFIILNNKTLKEIASIKPGSKEELIQAYGIGEAKAEEYGKDILSIVNAWYKRKI